MEVTDLLEVDFTVYGEFSGFKVLSFDLNVTSVRKLFFFILGHSTPI